MKKTCELKIFWIGIIAIVVWCIYNMFYLSVPFVADDEFCYWSIGAYFNGIDWSGITRNCAYYSYGYSIILSLLFKITLNTELIYKAAIFLNALYCCVIYYLMIKICLKRFAEINIQYIILAAFVSTLIPGVFGNLIVAWGECFIALLFWLALYFLDNIKCSKWNLYFFNGAIFALYIMHHRNLGLVVAAVLINIILLQTYPDFKKNIVYCAFLFIGLIYADKLLNEHLKMYLWKESASISHNGYSDQLKKLLFLMSQPHEWKNFAVNTIGKIWAMTMETFFCSIFGIMYCIKNSIFKRDGNKKDDLFCKFIMVSFVCMLGIVSVFFLKPTRIDQIVYGRYLACFTQLFFLLGIFYMYEQKKISNKAVLSMILVFGMSTICIHNYIKKEGMWEFNQISSIYLSNFYSEDGRFLTSIPFFISMSILLVQLLYKKKGIIVVLVGFLFFTSQMRTRESVIDTQRDYQVLKEDILNLKDFRKISYMIEKNWKDGRKNVIQFLEPEKTIYSIGKYDENIVLENDECYVLSNDSKRMFEVLLEGYVREEKETISIIKKNDSEKFDDKKIVIPSDRFSFLDFEKSEKGILLKGGGESGIAVMYGPNISLQRGGYKIRILLDLKKYKQQDIGYVAVKGEDEIVYYMGGLNPPEEGENNINCEMPIMVKQREENLEICLFLKDGSEAIVETVTIERVLN